ncbi:hypothetical protein LINGRAHAP2_LOCUS25531, partial [Linum grandiflorum]
GFSGPWWAVKQIATLPGPTHSLVVLFPPEKPIQIFHDRLLQRRLQSQRVESRRVIQIDGLPFRGVSVNSVAVNGVNFEHSHPCSHLLCRLDQVRLENYKRACFGRSST